MRRGAGLLVLIATCALGAGVSGRGGLDAVAASTDGKLVAVGGQNRVIYLLDSDKLTVQRRIYLGTRISHLAFNRDGSRLVVADETDHLHVIDVATGKIVSKRANCSDMVVSSRANLLVTRDLEPRAKHRLLFLNLSTLEVKNQVELPDRPISWIIDAKGETMYVLGASRPGDERAISAAEVPRDLRGIARWTFRQKNDGLESALFQVELATAKIVSTTTSWYVSDSDTTQLARVGPVTYVFNRINHCARIGPKGETTMFETGQGVNHAVATSGDGKILVTCGLGGGQIGSITGDKKVPFRLEELPGQAEFLLRLIFQEDGTMWGVTSAFRVVKINRFGKIEQVVPVY